MNTCNKAQCIVLQPEVWCLGPSKAGLSSVKGQTRQPVTMPRILHRAPTIAAVVMVSFVPFLLGFVCLFRFVLFMFFGLHPLFVLCCFEILFCSVRFAVYAVL